MQNQKRAYTFIINAVLLASTGTHALAKSTLYNDAPHPQNAHAQSPYENLVIFGNSLADPGNFYANNYDKPEVLQLRQNPAFYFNGRFSNGLVWPEYLAPTLGILPSHVHNYSYAGATIANKQDDILGTETDAAKTPVPRFNLTQQINQFLQSKLPSTQSKGKTLYVLELGGNDFIQLNEQAVLNPDAFIQKTVAELTSQLETVAKKAHATDFLVLNAPNITKTPGFQEIVKALNVALKKDGHAAFTAHDMARLIQDYNLALQKALAQVAKKHHLHIQRIDLNQILETIYKHPKKYGFTAPFFQPCFDPISQRACKNPAAHFYWDLIHPTTRGHQQIATMIQQIITPSTLTNTQNSSSSR